MEALHEAHTTNHRVLYADIACLRPDAADKHDWPLRGSHACREMQPISFCLLSGSVKFVHRILSGTRQLQQSRRNNGRCHSGPGHLVLPHLPVWPIRRPDPDLPLPGTSICASSSLSAVGTSVPPAPNHHVQSFRQYVALHHILGLVDLQRV